MDFGARRPSGRRDACPTTFWFVESPDAIIGAHWDHEPMEIPLTRPSDTLSPSGGEGRGEGVRWFMEMGEGFMDSCGIRCARRWRSAKSKFAAMSLSG